MVIISSVVIGMGTASLAQQRHASNLIAAESDLQMQMFDELGPKARAALNDECLRNPNIRALKSAFRKQWVDAWWEKQGIEGNPPPEKSFADLDDEFAEFIIAKTPVLCPLTGKKLECLQPEPGPSTKRQTKRFLVPRVRSFSEISKS